MIQSSSFPLYLDDVSLPEQLPPLVITAFTRPDLLQEVLSGISKQSLLPPKIIAFVDGPRRPSDHPKIEECINLLKEFSAVVPLEIIPRTENLGCDQNVISGFTEILSSYADLVYLEDDDLPNTCFYDRMCRLLEAYRHHQQVFSVSAYANIPKGFKEIINTEFMVSHRVFSWGFATWADRWQKLDLANHSGQYNPFGAFYAIPANIQTKLTMVNQFWLEKKQTTDWNITFTVASLYHQGIHITPMVSFIKNIGFGHAEAKTYKGGEAAWVNPAYDPSAIPNSLPPNLELPEPLKTGLSGQEFIKYLQSKKSIWLSPSALSYLLSQYNDLGSIISLLKLFWSRVPMMLKRWRQGLPI